MQIKNICCIGADYVGGPTMVRAAAKNYNDVTVITSPGQYEELIDEIKKNKADINIYSGISITDGEVLPFNY